MKQGASTFGQDLTRDLVMPSEACIDLSKQNQRFISTLSIPCNVSDYINL